MKNIIEIALVGIMIFVGCKGNDSTEKIKGKFNQELAEQLDEMIEIDQIAAYIPQGKYKELTKEEWKIFKDSVFITNQKRVKEIFDKYGFVGYDLAGEEGSKNFWLIVQHSDHVPTFQKRVLDKMKVEVERGNAKPSNYALLVDRVNKNQGTEQIYGTQVSYNLATGQAYIKNLFDSLNVNKRRSEMELESLESYLNDMSQSHYEMNKENYNKKGVMKPELYPIK